MRNKTCPICGKELSRFGIYRAKWTNKNYRPDLRGQDLHQDCYRKIDDSEPLCTRCAYHKLVDHVDAMGNEVWTTQSLSCRRFSMDVEGDEAKTCISYMRIEEYKEKALKGKISAGSLRNCQYCGTEYDKSKDVFCPKCGAS